MSNETDNKNNNKSVPKIRRTFRKVLKDGSNWSLLKVSGTALTAVSMALIASKLTTLVNSLVLVAIISIGTATLSEFYRIVLSITSLGAKKVVAPVLKIEQTNKKTGEIEIVDATSTVERDKTTDSNFKKVVHHLSHNPVIRMVLLFAVVDTLTVTTSYFISNSAEKVETTYTTVNNPTEELTDSEKQKITDDAASKSNEIVNGLKSRISTLEKDKQSLEDEISDLETENQSQSDKIDEILSQIDELKTQIEENSNQSSDEPTSEPTLTEEPTPIPTPTEEPTLTLSNSQTDDLTQTDTSTND